LTTQNYHAPDESATLELPFNPVAQAIVRRGSKRAAIEELFRNNIGRCYTSSFLHAEFGSAVRTRISEINRDPVASITIRNTVRVLEGGAEASVYWAEVRA